LFEELFITLTCASAMNDVSHNAWLAWALYDQQKRNNFFRHDYISQ